MESEYRCAVLLKGLNHIRDEQFRTVKFILAADLEMTEEMEDECDRIKIAKLMAEKFPVDAGLSKLIKIFKNIEELKDLAKKLQRSQRVIKGKKCKNTPVDSNLNQTPEQEMENALSRCHLNE